MFVIIRSPPWSILSPEVAKALREDRKQELKAMKKMTPEEVRQMLRSRGLLRNFRPISATKIEKKGVKRPSFK